MIVDSVLISFVFDETLLAIGLDEFISSLQVVSVTLFPLLLLVMSMGIVDGIVEVVFGVSL